MGHRQRQFGTRRGVKRQLDQAGEPVKLVGIDKGPIGEVALHGDQASDAGARRREQRQESAGVEPTAGGLDQILIYGLAGHEVDRARRRKVPVLYMVRALAHVEQLDGLGDHKMDIGIALPMRVASNVNRHVVPEQGHVGAVVGIEPP